MRQEGCRGRRGESPEAARGTEESALGYGIDLCGATDAGVESRLTLALCSILPADGGAGMILMRVHAIAAALIVTGCSVTSPIQLAKHKQVGL